VSLHTLKPELHEYITGRKNLDSVKRGIEAAIHAGLSPVKINTAMLRGLNVDEIPDLMEYAGRVRAILQLIELQIITDDDELTQYWVDLTNVEENLRKRAIRIMQRSLHGRKQYTIPIDDIIVQVEVVRPNHNQSFCQW
jgi:cyclic pyranopterin phosphate synthase